MPVDTVGYRGNKFYFTPSD